MESRLLKNSWNSHISRRCFSLQAVFENSNAAKSNATGLTKGKYVFKLVVKDNLANAAEATVEVTVNQVRIRLNNNKINWGGNERVFPMIVIIIIYSTSLS